MKQRRYQSGMGIPGMLIVAIMAGFFVMCIIKMAPVYFEYLSVKRIVSDIALNHNPETQSTGQIRRRLEMTFHTSQIYELDPRDVDVYRKKGKTYIDANYEVRMPIMWRIDAVMKFDDLVYIAGSPVAQPASAN